MRLDFLLQACSMPSSSEGASNLFRERIVRHPSLVENGGLLLATFEMLIIMELLFPLDVISPSSRAVPSRSAVSFSTREAFGPSWTGVAACALATETWLLAGFAGVVTGVGGAILRASGRGRDVERRHLHAFLGFPDAHLLPFCFL